MKDYLTTNIGKKVLAITLAIILWIIANFEQDIEKNIEIDIQYNDLSPNLIIKSAPPESLNLRGAETNYIYTWYSYLFSSYIKFRNATGDFI